MNKTLLEKRQLSYLLHEWDDINLPYTVNYKNIPNQVIKFFKTESKLVYPAKTIFVAIIYAKCLEEFFKVPFYEALDDDDLLPDDKYFKDYKYSKYKKEYDKILLKIGNIWQYDSILKTIYYFKKEFLIDGTNNKTDWSL
ncbi:MAG: hypothetical protein ACI4V7_08875 [Succinivibrionaceae bacterium]